MFQKLPIFLREKYENYLKLYLRRISRMYNNIELQNISKKS